MTAPQTLLAVVLLLCMAASAASGMCGLDAACAPGEALAAQSWRVAVAPGRMAIASTSAGEPMLTMDMEERTMDMEERSGGLAPAPGPPVQVRVRIQGSSEASAPVWETEFVVHCHRCLVVRLDARSLTVRSQPTCYTAGEGSGGSSSASWQVGFGSGSAPSGVASAASGGWSGSGGSDHLAPGSGSSSHSAAGGGYGDTGSGSGGDRGSGSSHLAPGSGSSSHSAAGGGYGDSVGRRSGSRRGATWGSGSGSSNSASGAGHTCEDDATFVSISTDGGGSGGNGSSGSIGSGSGSTRSHSCSDFASGGSVEGKCVAQGACNACCATCFAECSASGSWSHNSHLGTGSGSGSGSASGGGREYRVGSGLPGGDAVLDAECMDRFDKLRFSIGGWDPSLLQGFIFPHSATDFGTQSDGIIVSSHSGSGSGGSAYGQSLVTLGSWSESAEPAASGHPSDVLMASPLACFQVVRESVVYHFSLSHLCILLCASTHVHDAKRSAAARFLGALASAHKVS